MSRTIRRKNYEQEHNNSWRRKGRKCGGMFPQEEFMSEFQVERWSSIWHMGYYYYREPTEREYNKAYWEIHSDGRCWFTKPAKWYRQYMMHQSRMSDKTELRKFMADTDYEPMCSDKVTADYWD